LLKSNRLLLTILKSHPFLQQLKHGTHNLKEIINLNKFPKYIFFFSKVLE
jgi:hypothetical protein